MRNLSRAEKAFVFGLIGTPASIGLSFILPSFMNYILVPFAVGTLALFAFGGLVAAFENGQRNQLEEAYRSQV